MLLLPIIRTMIINEFNPKAGSIIDSVGMMSYNLPSLSCAWAVRVGRTREKNYN